MDGQRTTAMPLDIDEIIKALSHPVRRDMLRWLKEPEKYFVEQDHRSRSASAPASSTSVPVSPSPPYRYTSPPCNAPVW